MFPKRLTPLQNVKNYLLTITHYLYKMALFGFDLGGTKIEGVVINAKEDPSVLARQRLPTEKEKGYDHIIAQIAKVLKMLETETGIKAN